MERPPALCQRCGQTGPAPVAETLLVVVDLDDGASAEVPLSVFIRDNEEDADLCAELRALKIGASIRVGGGAAPASEITKRDGARPAWCTCKGAGGPYVAPPGHVTVVYFDTPAGARFRQECRLAGKEEREARDATIHAKWERRGRGWRERPLSHPIRAAAEKRYRRAVRALRKLQRACPHHDRSIFDASMCACCYATLDARRVA